MLEACFRYPFYIIFAFERILHRIYIILLISIPMEMQADAIVHLPNLPHVKRYALDEHNLILRSKMNTASFDDLWGECSLIR